MTGHNVDSVAEPIMVVTVITNTEQSIYYQVRQLNPTFLVHYSYATL